MKSILLFLLCAFWSWSVLAEQKQVVVSVHPMALLVKSAWPELSVASLVPANQSPHDFALKPSHIQLLADADALVWLGEEFEPYLASLAKRLHQVDLAQVNEDDHAHEAEHAAALHSHDHHGDAHDPHLWLDPEGIEGFLVLIGRELNLPKPQAFLRALSTWQMRAQSELAPYREVGFVSYHDAFVYWVRDFQLNQVAMLAENPEKPIGTRHLLSVRQQLENGHAACVFKEPQFESRLLEKLVRGLDVPVVTIDPMASQFDLLSADFIGFYDQLLAQFLTCVRAQKI